MIFRFSVILLKCVSVRPSVCCCLQPAMFSSSERLNDPSAMFVEASRRRHRRPSHPNHHITSNISPELPGSSYLNQDLRNSCSEAITPKPLASGHHNHHHLISPTSYERMSSPPTPSSFPSSLSLRQIKSAIIRSATSRHHLAYKLLFILHLICAFSSFSSSLAQVRSNFHTVTAQHDTQN